jgi:hypothetical protein
MGRERICTKSAKQMFAVTDVVLLNLNFSLSVLQTAVIECDIKRSPVVVE